MAAKANGALRAWEYPRGSGIRIREQINVHGGEAYGASYQVTVPAKLSGTVRERKQFPSKERAEQWACEQLRGFKAQGEGFFEATQAERNEFAHCLPKLREHGISLTEAVEFAIERLRPAGGERTVAQIVAEAVESKRIRFERGDLRERSYRDFENRARAFAEALGEQPVKLLTGEVVKAWLLELGLSPRTVKNYLAVATEVLLYGVQRRYLARSPIDDLTHADRKELAGYQGQTREPSILTPDRAERLILTAHAHPDLELLGAVTLGLFCGIRVEELKRLDWGQVRLDDEQPVVTIGAAIAKKRRIRHVDIPENAQAWLSRCGPRVGPLAPHRNHTDYERRFRKLLRLAGFGEGNEAGKWHSTWETNAMRHSFGTYHYALHRDSRETARLLGHQANDEVLFAHYRALATKQAAERFFGIQPPVKAGKVVEFAR